MPISIRLTQTGGPDVLQLVETELPAPGADEVLIEHGAIGVNYLDITQRNGAVKIPLPSGLGLEAAGTIRAVGSSVSEFVPGDRVAYILGAPGSYSDIRVISADRLIKLPREMSFEQAAMV